MSDEIEWKPWPGGECPHCGGNLEINTSSAEEYTCWDGDEVRCEKCHCPGYMTVHDEDDVVENMHDYSPECGCKWCKKHKVIDGECMICDARQRGKDEQ